MGFNHVFPKNLLVNYLFEPSRLYNNQFESSVLILINIWFSCRIGFHFDLTGPRRIKTLRNSGWDSRSSLCVLWTLRFTLCKQGVQWESMHYREQPGNRLMPFLSQVELVCQMRVLRVLRFFATNNSSVIPLGSRAVLTARKNAAWRGIGPIFGKDMREHHQCLRAVLTTRHLNY